ncbi:PIN domain-containing protein [Nocardia sp. NPDC058497]|uniref:PIN domain-containing protein n=1 Tax=Nocardia sp. NPDC058497 TaxID=3346529 RepID=UPI003656E8E1
MSGALVLDCEALAKAVRRDREVQEWLTAARRSDLPVLTSAAVLVEVIHPKIDDAALRWTLSRLRTEPVTQELAYAAAALLKEAGLHGHKYAIDAMLCATALSVRGAVTILTTDTDDIEKLAAAHLRVRVENGCE